MRFRVSAEPSGWSYRGKGRSVTPGVRLYRVRTSDRRGGERSGRRSAGRGARTAEISSRARLVAYRQLCARASP